MGKKNTVYKNTNDIEKLHIDTDNTFGQRKEYRLENKYRNIIPVRTNSRQNESENVCPDTSKYAFVLAGFRSSGTFPQICPSSYLSLLSRFPEFYLMYSLFFVYICISFIIIMCNVRLRSLHKLHLTVIFY